MAASPRVFVSGHPRDRPSPKQPRIPLRRAKTHCTLMTLLGSAGALLLVTIVCLPITAAQSELEVNDRPIIGIVEQFWRPDKGTGET